MKLNFKCNSIKKITSYILVFTLFLFCFHTILKNYADAKFSEEEKTKLIEKVIPDFIPMQLRDVIYNYQGSEGLLNKAYYSIQTNIPPEENYKQLLNETTI